MAKTGTPTPNDPYLFNSALYHEYYNASFFLVAISLFLYIYVAYHVLCG